VSGRQSWLTRLGLLAGIDRAVAYTALARATQIFGSVGTVLLIVRFLTPVGQGYYYTLLSLVMLQTIFELGFSFVIQQLAAHESIVCRLQPDGGFEGEPVAYDRLASIAQLTVRWYFRAGLVLVVVLLPLGLVFFSQKVRAEEQIGWLGPWITAVLASSLTFLLTPLYSFLEGCNQINQVARMRLIQSCAVIVASWGAIASGHGLYACTCVNIGVVSVGLVFLARRRRLLRALLKHRAGANAVSWRVEVWPFQWKIAVSSLCAYFTAQVFTPILFMSRGPLDAGRMGLSLSIVNYLPVLVLSWLTTKATPFGQLVKLGQLQELDRLFFRTLKQSSSLILLLAAACLGAVIVAHQMLPGIALRMESPLVFGLLLLTAIGTFLVQGMAVYLRSFKREPYLVQSIVVSSLTLLAIALAAPRWGNLGVAITYFVCSGLLGLIWAAAILRRQRAVQAVAAGASDGARAQGV